MLEQATKFLQQAHHALVTGQPNHAIRCMNRSLECIEGFRDGNDDA